jgi:CheY-like chemotaxis protein
MLFDVIGRVPHVGKSGGAKARVLLVDDHQQVLDRVSTLLSEDFDVAGVATDGWQALHSARQIAPDLIVLDINMPRLNGFETMRALKQAGSRAPVVFLSMLDDEDTVGEAFQCGGHGYVLKSQVARDLVMALDQVRHGRLFAPSLTSLFHLTGGPGVEHAMQLYGDPSSFVDGLATFFDLALERGDATCVITGSDLRDGLEARLRNRGWDVGGPSGHERYLAVDAAAAVGRFMRNGLPDADVLAEIAAELDEYRRDVTDGGTGRLTIFGNMAMSLIENGNPDAAMALEALWDSLTHDLPFFTICGYTAGCFHSDLPDLWSSTCAQHSAVSQHGVAR